LLLTGCDSEPVASDAADAVADAGLGTPPADTGFAPLDWQDVCDGSSAVRLYHARGGGGMIAPGSQAIYEVGFYLIVRGDCRYWIYASPDGVVRSAVLDAEQVRALIRALRLSELKGLAGDYAWSACDGPEGVYWFDSQRVRVFAVCSDVNPHDAEVADSLLQGWQSTATELMQTGVPVTGDVWFSLYQVPADVLLPSSNGYRNAPSWPLDTDPGKLAGRFTADGEYIAGASHRVSGEDAAALRSLRSDLLEKRIGLESFVPIVQPDGRTYELYVRDAIELEDDAAQLPFDW
jgi:hypothetical protein